jgi:hypothetical protein
MANVFDSGLVVSTISQQVQTVLANRLAPLRLFTSDFSNEVKKAKDTIQVPIVSATAATSVNPTNFEPGSSVTIGKATVTLDHVAQFFGIDQADLALGHRLENLIKINVDALADKLWSLAITPITTVNFGAATVTTTTITPGSGHLASLWSAISKSTNKGLVVTPAIYSALIPTNADFLPLQNGAYGFDQGVFYANSFTGAVSWPRRLCLLTRSGLRGLGQADDRPCGFLAVPDQRSSRDPRSVGPLGLLERLGFDQQSPSQRLH